MLKIANIIDGQQNLVAPTVYIDGVELENDDLTVFYSIEDAALQWLADDIYLSDNMFYLSVGNQNYKETLLSLKKKNIKGHKISGYQTFKYSSIQPTPYIDVEEFTITGSVSTTTISGRTEITGATLTTRRQSGYGIVSFCGSEGDYTGHKTIEHLLLNGSFPTSSYKNNQFRYVNKIKNLNILKITINL